MPLNLQVSGADFSGSAYGRVLRLTTDRTSLVGEYLFGRNAATSLINSAGPAVPSTPVAPTYGNHRVSMDAAESEVIDTGVLDAANITLAIVAAFPTGGGVGCSLMATTQSKPQVYLYTGASGLVDGELVMQTGGSDSSDINARSTATLATPLSDFRMIAGRVIGTSNVAVKVDEYKGGARLKGAVTTTTNSRTLASQPIKIGTGGSTTLLAGPFDCAAALIWHRALTDAELLAAYQEVRGVLGTMGIAC